MSWTMEQSTLANGPERVSELGEEFRSGKMVPSMKACGSTIWQTVEAD